MNVIRFLYLFLSYFITVTYCFSPKLHAHLVKRQRTAPVSSFAAVRTNPKLVTNLAGKPTNDLVKNAAILVATQAAIAIATMTIATIPIVGQIAAAAKALATTLVKTILGFFKRIAAPKLSSKELYEKIRVMVQMDITDQVSAYASDVQLSTIIQQVNSITENFNAVFVCDSYDESKPCSSFESRLNLAISAFEAAKQSSIGIQVNADTINSAIHAPEGYKLRSTTQPDLCLGPWMNNEGEPTAERGSKYPQDAGFGLFNCNNSAWDETLKFTLLGNGKSAISSLSIQYCPQKTDAFGKKPNLEYRFTKCEGVGSDDFNLVKMWDDGKHVAITGWCPNDDCDHEKGQAWITCDQDLQSKPDDFGPRCLWHQNQDSQGSWHTRDGSSITEKNGRIYTLFEKVPVYKRLTSEGAFAALRVMPKVCAMELMLAAVYVQFYNDEGKFKTAQNQWKESFKAMHDLYKLQNNVAKVMVPITDDQGEVVQEKDVEELMKPCLTYAPSDYLKKVQDKYDELVSEKNLSEEDRQGNIDMKVRRSYMAKYNSTNTNSRRNSRL